jgi:translocation and assembly module TamB
MVPDDFPHAVDEIKGILLFYEDAVVLDRLQASVAGGLITAAGRTTVPRNGTPAEYRLQMKGKDLKVRYPEGWSLHGDAELSVTSANPLAEEGIQAKVSGRLKLNELQYLDDLPVSFSQILRGFFERQRLEVGETDAILSAISLNLAIEAPNAVKMRNNLAQVEGSADLLLGGTVARPTLYGEVELDPGGRLRFNNADYEIERGTLTFANPYTLEPEVDLVAVTEVRAFDITLLLSGTLDRLETSFSSEPPLPDFEVFRMLATGDEQELDDRTTRRLAEGGDDQSSSAATFLYGQAASVIGQRVSSLFGLDKFRIDPLTESGDAISKARITVGKRVSKDLFLTYSVDPSSTEEQRLRI